MKIILTFKNLTSTLMALKLLRAENFGLIRPTPTPSGCKQAVCNLSLEIINHSQLAEINSYLTANKLIPVEILEIS